MSPPMLVSWAEESLARRAGKGSTLDTSPPPLELPLLLADEATEEEAEEATAAAEAMFNGTVPELLLLLLCGGVLGSDLVVCAWCICCAAEAGVTSSSVPAGPLSSRIPEVGIRVGAGTPCKTVRLLCLRWARAAALPATTLLGAAPALLALGEGLLLLLSSNAFDESDAAAAMVEAGPMSVAGAEASSSNAEEEETLL